MLVHLSAHRQQACHKMVIQSSPEGQYRRNICTYSLLICDDELAPDTEYIIDDTSPTPEQVFFSNFLTFSLSITLTPSYIQSLQPSPHDTLTGTQQPTALRTGPSQYVQTVLVYSVA
jgi:hypothetical protein